MLNTLKQDVTKAIQFSNTFRYIDDLLSVNNEEFENYISTIYPSELELKNTFTSTPEVCYHGARIKLGDNNSPFYVSIYDKRDDFAFRIVNFPPTHGVYMSQLVLEMLGFARQSTGGPSVITVCLGNETQTK